MRRALALVIAVAAATPAWANGRFPASTNVVTRPGDADDIYLAITFGLLISRDDGAHFHWVCESNIGYSGNFDPKYAVGPDGTIYATTYQGLRVSYDGGCSFTTADDEVGPIWVDAIDVDSEGAVWIGTAENGVVNAIYRSTDQAHSFTEMALSSKTAWWKSVQVAPSDTQRVYVTGYQVSAGTQVLAYRSTNGGASFDPLPLTDITLGSNPLVLFEGVDPDDPDIVYLRSVGVDGPARDKLYRSANGGETWTEVLFTDDTIRALTIRASGELVIGTVLSDDPERGCTYTSTGRGTTFSACTHGPKMACVEERADGALFACGANWDPDLFTLGRSEDAQAWSKVIRFHEMQGPLRCPQGTEQYDVCELRQWPAVREQFGVTGPIDGGPSATPDAGVPPGDDKPGCCDSGGGAATAGVLVLLGAVLVWRGRRRRKPCCS